jgi:hypothetical protein
MLSSTHPVHTNVGRHQVEHNNILQKAQSLIPTIHLMYFHDRNVTVLEQGGLQAAYVAWGGGGVGGG